jgi:hypothetical protein
MANPLPPPSGEPITNPRAKGTSKFDPQVKVVLDGVDWLVNDTWLRFFMNQSQTSEQAPTRVVAPISLVQQGASIGATAIAPGQVASGLYALEYYARITTADTVSSSLTVTFGWTDHGQAVTFACLPAITGNTVTTVDSRRLMVYLDALAPITYATTYATVGASPMKYELYVTITSVGL